MRSAFVELMSWCELLAVPCFLIFALACILTPCICSKANFTTETKETDVLVIGGAAGVFAATKACDAGAKVTMVVKGRLGSSGLTPLAKGVFSYDKRKIT